MEREESVPVEEEEEEGGVGEMPVEDSSEDVAFTTLDKVAEHRV